MNATIQLLLEHAKADDVAADLEKQIASLQAALNSALETFRHTGPVLEFAKRAAQIIGLRNEASARLGAVRGTTDAKPLAVHEEVWGLLQACRLRRGDVIEYMRAQRPRLLVTAQAELDDINRLIASTAET